MKKYLVVFVLLVALVVPMSLFAYGTSPLRISGSSLDMDRFVTERLNNHFKKHQFPPLATSTVPINDPATTTVPANPPATTTIPATPPATDSTSSPQATTSSTTSGWQIKSIDVMKYSKDVVCNPPSQSEIDTQVQKAVDLGANYISISGFYDDPSCAPDLPLITNWVNSIRSHGLHVWFRMKDLNFEGDYSVQKGGSLQSHIDAMMKWIDTNKSLIAQNDMFTPFAEIQNGGINGVSYCALGVCQFQSATDFNSFIRTVQTTAKNALPQAKVGYYGFDGFIAAGLGNPDWQGKSQLEPATIAAMGEITIDHYPETISHTFEQDLPIVHQAVGANIPILIGEYGTITSGSDSQQVQQINVQLPMLKADSGVIGMNYWDLGPSGTEALVNSDYSNKPGFDALKATYK